MRGLRHPRPTLDSSRRHQGETYHLLSLAIVPVKYRDGRNTMRIWRCVQDRHKPNTVSQGHTACLWLFVIQKRSTNEKLVLLLFFCCFYGQATCFTEGISCTAFLFMIPFAGSNGEGAVENFQKQHPHQLMWEGQLGNRKPKIARTLYLVTKTVRGADNQA